MKARVLSVMLCFIFLGGIPSLTVADSTVLIVKAGSFKLSDDAQTIGSISAMFDDKASSVFGGELEWRRDDGLAFGIEAFTYSNDVDLGVFGTDEMTSVAVMGNVKKYFSPSQVVRPYIGAGAGIGTATIDGSGSGLAFQIMAGVDFRFENVGLYTEFKSFTSEPEDIDGADVETSGSGFFAGVSIQF